MRKTISLLLSLVFLTITNTAFAQPAPDGRDFSQDKINLGSKQNYGVDIDNPNASVGGLLGNFLQIMFIIGGLAVLVFLVWGAFDWITSGGDKEKIAGARRKIMNAIIGLFLLALAAFIVSLFGEIAGFNPLSPTAKPIPKLGDPITP